MRPSVIPFAALALAACNQAPGNEAALDNAAGVSRNYAAEVLAMPDGPRNGVFLRAIRDAGFPCQGVAKSERVADAGAGPRWRATCNDGTPHVVQITPDGTARILSRTDL